MVTSCCYAECGMPDTSELERIERQLIDEMEAARYRYAADKRFRSEYTVALARFNQFVIHRKLPDESDSSSS